MSDERQHTDSELLMRSILADAQEEVPAHIWEGVSEELDRIDVSKRKMFAPWLRRSAVAVAAAAVVVCGLVIDWKDDENTLVPEAVIPEMVAVVETITEKPDTTTTQEFDRQHFTPKYIADAGVAAKESCPVCIESHISDITHDHDMTDAKTLSAEQGSNVQKEYFPEEWPEEEYKKRHRTNTAIVLSGIAGTNSVTNNHGTGFIKFPSISTIKPQTGVKQTSEDSSYGLPLSIGAGVKIGVSERWAIGTGISYTMLSRKFQGYYTHVDEEGKIEVSPPSDIRNTQHYLGIPITAYYNIVNQEHISFYAYAHILFKTIHQSVFGNIELFSD